MAANLRLDEKRAVIYHIMDLHTIIRQIMSRYSGQGSEDFMEFTDADHQKFCDEVVPEAVSSKLALFSKAKSIDFQNDECFSGGLVALLEPYGGGSVGLWSSEDDRDGFCLVFVKCEGEEMGGFEMFLLVSPEQWCAIISAQEHPYIHSNVFSYESSCGGHYGFEFDDDGEAQTAIAVADKWFKSFCVYSGNG
jgi:hypothetical protein